MEDVKRNKAYAGQVVDVVRAKNRISFNDCLKKMTDKDGDPYLNIFAPQSIYLMSLLDFNENKSVRANLPLRDLPLIYKKTDYAEAEIFNQQKFGSGEKAKTEEKTEESKKTEISPAFTPLKIGTFAGKTPGDILLTADDPEKAKNDLLRQVNFLKSKLSSYPANQAQIDAIESAIDHFELGVLENMKPGAGTGENKNVPVESPGASGTYIIYKTPIKHQKKKNERGKNECYSVSITCTPAKTYPYRIEIMNCYAPLKKLANGLQPIMMDQAEDQKTYSIDLTEAEWLYIISCLNENTQNTKSLWYQEMRVSDDKNRWKGNTQN